MTLLSSDIYLNKTRSAYLWTRILNTPFWALYSILHVIIYKDLHATPWQVACIISIKPIASLLSFYWSSLVRSRSDRLISNVVWAGILGHLPFFFCPFIDSPWFFVFAAGIYMLFSRGVVPAWMEILKLNVSTESRKKVFAYGSAFYHVGGAILPLGMGWLLDDYFQSWRWLFPLTALISLFAIFFQAFLPIRTPDVQEEKEAASLNLMEQFKKPWQEAWRLLRQRPDFARFQIGFMLGGGGLMLWLPASSIFLVDVLHLSYKEVTMALNLCKGIGYALALPLWTRWMNKSDLFLFSALVTFIAALFPVALMAAQIQLLWLYFAYLLYGAMQAGSELSWNLSGPIFARHEDSSTYSGVNVVSIGIRGCVAPPLGSLLCSLFNTIVVLLLGGSLCLLATWQMYRSSRKEQENLLLSPD
jgi:predicted MFS family arabinose efflux permease